MNDIIEAVLVVAVVYFILDFVGGMFMSSTNRKLSRIIKLLEKGGDTG